MINPQELRIGNTVKYKTPFMQDYDLVLVESIISDGLVDGINYSFSNENYILSFELQPVPVTEEWLLKFGFEKENISWFKNMIIYKRDSFILHYLDHEFNPVIEDNSEGYFLAIGNDIKYVHQLQNLYFDLTGEELTIKE
jgi:hypothetical protein